MESRMTAAVKEARGIEEGCTIERELAEAVRLLEKAVESVRAWHGMGMSPKDESELWEIYWNHSPEMLPIRAFLTSLKGKEGL